MISGYIYSTTFVTPLYQSSAKIILVKQESSNVKQELANLIGANTGELTTNDITLNQKLVSTYSEIIKSRAVLTVVKENQKLDKDVAELARSITVSPVKDTEVINISVKTDSAKEAALVANELVSVFTEEVKRIYGIENVQVVDKAIANETPVNIATLKNMAIFTLAAVMLIYGFVF